MHRETYGTAFALSCREYQDVHPQLAGSHVCECKTSNVKICARQGSAEGRARCVLNAGGGSLKRHLKKGRAVDALTPSTQLLKGAFISSTGAVPLPTITTVQTHRICSLCSHQEQNESNAGKCKRYPPPPVSLMHNPYYLIGCVHLGTDCIHGGPLLQAPGFLLLCSVGLPLDTETERRGERGGYSRRHDNQLQHLAQEHENSSSLAAEKARSTLRLWPTCNNVKCVYWLIKLLLFSPSNTNGIKD